MKTITLAVWAALSVAVFAGEAPESTGKSLIWTDPATATAQNRSFGIQGEYLGVGRDGKRYGVQLRAADHWEYSRGTGKWFLYQQFVGVLYQASGKAPENGGLPGLGKEEDTEFVCDLGGRWRKTGTPRGDEVIFSMDEGPYSGNTQGKTLELYDASYERGDKPIATLTRTERKSPTLGAKPPEHAVVLFDGGSDDAWIKGGVENGLLSGSDMKTKQAFRSYRLHLEFRTPYIVAPRHDDNAKRPPPSKANNPGGLFHQGRYETQIRDSFCGLSTLNWPPTSLKDACGVIHGIAPRVNACFPSLVWQTYDADFTAAKFDAAGKQTQPAKITVRLNGILVHENLELPKARANAPDGSIALDAAPLFIQHKNYPVHYRNIWILPR